MYKCKSYFFLILIFSGQNGGRVTSDVSNQNS